MLTSARVPIGPVLQAILAEGSVVVSGTGRLVLDGDASDLILKVSGEYLSLRTLLDLGTGLDYTRPDSVVDEDNGDEERSTLLNLCRDDATCPWRRNWGLDACTPLDVAGDYVCACGGGWEYGSGLVRLRHFVCSGATPSERTECFKAFNKRAPLCCAPQVDLLVDIEDPDATVAGEAPGRPLIANQRPTEVDWLLGVFVRRLFHCTQ